MNGTKRNVNATVHWCLILVGLVGASLHAPSISAEEVRLAAEGRALLSIKTASTASPRVQAAAATLADYLTRMTGAKFMVVVDDKAPGLVVGTVADFPQFRSLPLQPEVVTGREDYLLRTHAAGAWLIGATDLAVEHAVWDFLDRAGYRQFFPGAAWEIVPRNADLRLDVDVIERPAYYQRDFQSGHGFVNVAQRDAYRSWSAKNRATAGLEVQAGHAYGAIIRANQAEFDRHPEYLSLIDDKRVPRQLCISNPGLRKLVGEHAVRYFLKNPDKDCISLEPNDGSGHCQCEACQRLGSVSDRVVTLANHGATVVNQAGLGEKYVGLLAYHLHSAAPTVRVHPRVIVRLSFYGESTADRAMELRLRLMADWQKQGATIGISEYLNTFVWDHALPARAKGSNLGYLKQSIPLVHAHGARFYHASLGNGWGPTGLGSYVATRILWNPREADRVDELVDDFLHKAFGAAAQTMAEYYRLIDAGHGALLSEDLVGRLYRTLAKAKRQTAHDAAAQTPLEQLILYTRYVELHRLFDIAAEEDRPARLEALLRHSYRIRDTAMAHFRGAVANLPRKVPPGAFPPAERRESDEPITPDEISQIVTAGVASNRLLDFTPVRFEDDLVPAAPLKLTTKKAGTLGGYPPRTRNLIYTWLDRPGEISLRISGHGGRSGKVTTEYRLFAAESVTDDPADRFAGVLEKGRDVPITLKSPYAGRHWIEALGPSLAMEFTDEGRALTLPCDGQAPFSYPNWSLYFYVPLGTQVVGGFAATKDGEILDGDGNTVFAFNKLDCPGYFSVPVPKGQDGKLWFFSKCRGRRQLMTVPPYLARDAKELLLPREVVEKDSVAN